LAPLENSPDVMVHRAQDLARKFGYKDIPRDTAFWYQRNLAFLAERAKTLPQPEIFADLKAAQQGHHNFYYRQSPQDMLGWNTNWTVNYNSPPQNITGMITVALQADGSLDHFLAITPQVASVAEETRPATDGNADGGTFAGMFAESGLDAKRF